MVEPSYFLFQPGCVNTTEMDIKKACRMHRPMKSVRHLSVAVAGGRISPSVSDVELHCPAASIQKEIEFLRKKLARTNIKVGAGPEENPHGCVRPRSVRKTHTFA